MSGSPGSYRLVVIELDNAQPRLRRTRANLLVATTLKTPEAYLEGLRAGEGRGPKWAHGRAVRLRPDLKWSKKYPKLQSARNAEKILIRQLRLKGHRVNQLGRLRSVYVIELDTSHPQNPRGIQFYVGETGLTPQRRFAQHRERAVNRAGHKLWSKLPAECGVRLRPRLGAREQFFTQQEAEIAETLCGQRLEQMGYTVAGPHREIETDGDTVIASQIQT